LAIGVSRRHGVVVIVVTVAATVVAMTSADQIRTFVEGKAHPTEALHEALTKR
jgi:hypothetical protein